MGSMLAKLREIFLSHKMEIVLLGLENSGKTTLLNQLALGQSYPSAPTIGLNIKQVKKDGINMKVWDIGGQVQFRREWGKYAKGSDVILFMIDTSSVKFKFKRETLPIIKRELNILLDDNEIHGIPILFIGNKIDIDNHMNQQEIIQGMLQIKGLNLDYLNTNQWAVTLISALRGTNLSDVMQWLIKKSKSK